jgi:hypothetical protein
LRHVSGDVIAGDVPRDAVIITTMSTSAASRPRQRGAGDGYAE